MKNKRKPRKDQKKQKHQSVNLIIKKSIKPKYNIQVHFLPQCTCVVFWLMSLVFGKLNSEEI